MKQEFRDTLTQKILQKDTQNLLHLKQHLSTNPESPTQSFPTYQLNSSGCRNRSQLMQFPIFRIVTSLALLNLQTETRQPYCFMITASHNPATDNGIKIGYAGGNVMESGVYAAVGGLLRDDGRFGEFVSGRLEGGRQRVALEELGGLGGFAVIGEDCRPSSQELSGVACEALGLLGIRVINIGRCSTPELFSLSQYIIKNNLADKLNTSQKINNMKQRYIQQTMHYFKTSLKMINTHTKPDPNKTQSLKILLDFSNGSGSISFPHYKPHLAPYLTFHQTNNTRFDKVNHQCGAEYYHKNWHLVKKSQQFEEYDECFFFDGDADRVVARVAGLDCCFDGNYFIVVYVGFLRELVGRVGGMGLLGEEEGNGVLQVNAISTTVVNFGIKLGLKKMGMELHTTNVGTLNLFIKATTLPGISVFFQPNGHGGIYYPPNTVTFLERLLEKNQNNLQLNLLYSIYKILKNNSKGYGLHNMLVYRLIRSYYHQQNKLDMKNLVSFVGQYTKNFHILKQKDHEFENSKQGKCQLCKPTQLVEQIRKIGIKYEEYAILVRKSATQPGVIRVNVQGMDANLCTAINQEIYLLFLKGGYVLKEDKLEH